MEPEDVTECLRLLRTVHVSYLHSGLGKLPSGFASLDASRPWIVYWLTHSLALLGADMPASGPSAAQVVEFLKLCQAPGGGFGGSPMQIPHLAPTYAAVAALISLGGEAALQAVDRQAMDAYLRSLIIPPERGGGFAIHHGAPLSGRRSSQRSLPWLAHNAPTDRRLQAGRRTCARATWPSPRPACWAWTWPTWRRGQPWWTTSSGARCAAVRTHALTTHTPGPCWGPSVTPRRRWPPLEPGGGPCRWRKTRPPPCPYGARRLRACAVPVTPPARRRTRAVWAASRSTRRTAATPTAGWPRCACWASRRRCACRRCCTGRRTGSAAWRAASWGAPTSSWTGATAFGRARSSP